MKKISLKKYGIVNSVIIILCVVCLLFNSLIVSQDALKIISPNIGMAYVLNFLFGCQGELGKLGTMSGDLVFNHGQWWRLFIHIFLHVGVIHMVLNIMALIVLGKYIERKLGSIKYGLYFIGISVLDALIISLIYPNNMSVGASGGIFGVIGVAFVMKLMKKDTFQSLKKGEVILLIIFIILSSVLGDISFLTHLIAFTIGGLVGSIDIVYSKKNKSKVA